MGRIEKEKKTITLMIDIYCKKKHKHKDGLCEECQELLEYAHKRLDFCKFGEEKSFCSKCPIHCYKKRYESKSKRCYEIFWAKAYNLQPNTIFQTYI